MSFELDNYHFIALGVNFHDREIRIQGNFYLTFWGNSGDVTDHKASTYIYINLYLAKVAP